MKKLKIGKSDIHGKGLFTGEPIRKGDLIAKVHSGIQLDPETVKYMPTQYGRFYNHDEKKFNTTNEIIGNHRYLRAIKNIPANTELTANYREHSDMEQPENFGQGKYASFDFDKTIATDEGLAKARQMLKDGYNLFIVSARDKVTPDMVARARKAGIPEENIIATGSDEAKVRKVKQLGVEKHFDDKPEVIAELGLVGEQFKKGGGLNSKKYTRSITGTNKLFTKNKLFKKKSTKRIYDPNAKYYAEGGESGCPEGQYWNGEECIPEMQSIVQKPPYYQEPIINPAAYVNSYRGGDPKMYKYGFLDSDQGQIIGGGGFGFPKPGVHLNALGVLPMSSDDREYFKGAYEAGISKDIKNLNLGLGVGTAITGYPGENGFVRDPIKFQPRLNLKYNFAEGGALLTKKVTCKKCGWKWDAADGGDDITTCHKCGGQGLVHAQIGGGLHKFVEGGAILDLTENEITEYRRGGYIVEELDDYEDGGEPCPIGLVWDETLQTCVKKNTQDIPTQNINQYSKYISDYESKNSIDDFVNQKKADYLKKNKGLNKIAGLSQDNFPEEVENNFRKEYEYNKNSEVIKQYAKDKGINPNKHVDLVENLADKGQVSYDMVANSKYGSKLQPNLWSRSLAGAQELGNFASKIPGAAIDVLQGKAPRDRGDLLNFNIPGLTKKEQKEIHESPFGALETLSALDIFGAAVANRAVDLSISTGGNYQESPGIFSGELKSNVNPMQAALLNPLAYAGLGEMMAGKSLLGLTADALKPGAKNLGKFLGAESGVLSNAYKVNPFAFKPNPEAYYRTLGKEGIDDAFSSGVLRPKQTSNIYSPEAGKRIDVKAPEFPEGSYFNKGSLYSSNKMYNPDYMAEVVGKDNLFTYPERVVFNENIRVAPNNIPIENAQFYKKDWLQGYKEVPKQLPGSPNVASSVDDVGNSIKPVQAGFGNLLNLKGALQKYPKGNLTPKEIELFKNSEYYKNVSKEHLQYKEKYGDRWKLGNHLDEAIIENNRYYINHELYNGTNWEPADYMMAGVIGGAMPTVAGLYGYALAPSVIRNKINKTLGITMPVGLSTDEISIDITNLPMDYAKVNEIKDGKIIIGGEFIEDANNTVRKAKDWLIAKDTYSDKKYLSKDVESFYGIKDGKFIVGKANKFNPDDEIVPIRFGTKNISKAIMNGDEMRILDNKNQPIYQNTPNTGKFILYSPTTKKATFNYINTGESGVKKINAFLKKNKDAQYIHLDNGRYEYYTNNENGLTEQDFKNYYEQDFERKGNPGYNLIIKKQGGSIELELDDEQVQEYIKRGYDVEEVNNFSDGGIFRRRKQSADYIPMGGANPQIMQPGQDALSLPTYPSSPEAEISLPEYTPEQIATYRANKDVYEARLNRQNSYAPEDLVYKDLVRPKGHFVLAEDMSKAFLKELKDNGFYANKTSQGDYEVFSNKDIANLIYTKGITPTELATKFKLGDSKELKTYFEPVYTNASMIHAKRNTEKINDLVEQGYTKEKAISELVKEGEGTKTGLNNLYGKYTDAAYNKNEAEVEALTSMGIGDPSKLTDYQREMYLNIKNFADTDYQQNVQSAKDQVSSFGNYDIEPAESTAIRNYAGFNDPFTGQYMQGNNTTAWEENEGAKVNAATALDKYNATTAMQAQAAKEILGSDKLSDEDRKRFLENPDEFNKILQQYVQYSSAPQGETTVPSMLNDPAYRVTPGQEKSEFDVTPEGAAWTPGRYEKGRYIDGPVDMMYPEKYFMGPGAGLIGGGFRGLTRALEYAPLKAAPWLTGGNALNAYMGYETVKPGGLISESIAGFKEGDKLKGYGNAGMSALNLLPFVGPTVKGLKYLDDLNQVQNIGDVEGMTQAGIGNWFKGTSGGSSLIDDATLQSLKANKYQGASDDLLTQIIQKKKGEMQKGTFSNQMSVDEELILSANKDRVAQLAESVGAAPTAVPDPAKGFLGRTYDKSKGIVTGAAGKVGTAASKPVKNWWGNIKSDASNTPWYEKISPLRVSNSSKANINSTAAATAVENTTKYQTVDEIAQSMYGSKFDELTGLAKAQVDNAFKAQPLPSGAATTGQGAASTVTKVSDDILLKNKISREKYGEDYDKVSSWGQMAIDKEFQAAKTLQQEASASLQAQNTAASNVSQGVSQPASSAVEFSSSTPRFDLQDVGTSLTGLYQRGKYWDETGAKGDELLNSDMIKYHGTHSGRPIVEVKMPDGSSEFFYKSTGWAGKESNKGLLGFGKGTTESAWQPFGGFSNTPTTKNWFIKDAGYKDYYGSNTFKGMAENLDDALKKKFELKSTKELDNAINFQNKNSNVDSFTPMGLGIIGTAGAMGDDENSNLMMAGLPLAFMTRGKLNMSPDKLKYLKLASSIATETSPLRTSAVLGADATNIKTFMQGTAINDGLIGTAQQTKGAFNKGVFNVVDDPNFIIKIEHPATVGGSRGMPDYENINMAEAMQNISGPTFGKVHHQVVSPTTGNRALILNKLEGAPYNELTMDDYLNMSDDGLVKFHDDLQTLKKNNLGFDFTGNNYMFDRNKNQFQLFDIDPHTAIANPDKQVTYDFFQTNVYGGGNPLIFGSKQAGLNLQGAMQNRLSGDISRKLYEAGMSDPDVLGITRSYEDRLRKLIRGLNYEKDGGSIEIEIEESDIDKYVKGGYVVEDISVPSLNYNQGGAINRFAVGGQTPSAIWRQYTGTPWSEAKKQGLTDGTAKANLALRDRVLAGEFGEAKMSDEEVSDRHEAYKNMVSNMISNGATLEELVARRIGTKQGLTNMFSELSTPVKEDLSKYAATIAPKGIPLPKVFPKQIEPVNPKLKTKQPQKKAGITETKDVLNKLGLTPWNKVQFNEPVIENNNQNFEKDLLNRLTTIAKQKALLKPETINKVEPIANSQQLKGDPYKKFYDNNGKEIKPIMPKMSDFKTDNPFRETIEGTGKFIKDTKESIGEYIEYVSQGINRKSKTYGFIDNDDIKVPKLKENDNPLGINEYYKNLNSTQQSFTIPNSNRNYKQQVLPISNIKLGYRNRGDYNDIKSEGLELTTFHPFTNSDKLKNITDNTSVFALDADGNLHTGQFKDFKNNKDWKFSQTYMNKIIDIEDLYIDGSKSGNPGYKQPKVKVLENGKIKDGSLNILTKGKDKDDYYGSIQGGRILFVNPVTKEQYLVSGSLSTIKKEFKKLKGTNQYLEAWTLDNGTYSRGLSYNDKKLTADRLKAYDNENSSGGNGLYIMNYKTPVNEYEEEYVLDMPNLRTKNDASYKKGHKLKNEVKNIVLHHTAYEDINNNESQVRTQYMTPGKSSSHVVIEEDGKRTVYASPEQVTFHAGESEWNGRKDVNDFSIGVEFQGNTVNTPLTDAQIKSFIEYYRPIATKYNLSLKDVISHQMISPDRKPDVTAKEYQRILKYMKEKGFK